MRVLLAVILSAAIPLEVAAQVDAFGGQPFGIGGSVSAAIGNATRHNLGNGVTGRSFRSGAISTHTFSNAVTGKSYDHGNKTNSYFSNGIRGTTYRYGNQSMTTLSNGRTISCHTFGSITRCK